MCRRLNQNNRTFVKSIIGAIFLIFIAIVLPAIANDETKVGVEEKLAELGEEQLLMFYSPGDILVTSSARRSQPMKKATSAMYVITKEDIRQSGVTTLADILRLVPGMEVLHMNGYDYAVSSRGFAKQSSQRLQTLLDGMPLYNPSKGGMDFSFHPVFLDNIERIEVIRGSGGVTWGVNAMNGVINIITKKATDTKGGTVYGGIGNRELTEGFIRYGGTNGKLDWRGTVGKFRNHGFGTDHGDSIPDESEACQATGRADLRLNDTTTLTFSGGHKYTNHSRVKANGAPNTARGRGLQYMNLIWNKQLDDNESLQVRFSENYYYQLDRSNRNTVRTREEMIELQHNFIYDDIHNIVWGGDYTLDNVHIGTKSGTPQQLPTTTYDSQVSAFIQDEITLRNDLWLTIGYRGHHNERSFYDWAGIVALVHEIRPKHFIRAAVSRSFRKPIFWEDNANNNTTAGNKSLRNEKLLAYELGYRGQLRNNLELNIEGFLNKHENLIGNVGSSNPKQYQNCLNVTTYGVETAVDWRPYNWWLIRGFHVYEHQTNDNKLRASTSNLKVASVPSNKAGLTNRFYLKDNITLNTQLFWSETCANKVSAKVPAYTRFDIRLAKRFWNDKAELAFGITNLQEHMHYEGGTASTSEVPRQVYFQFFCKF